MSAAATEQQLERWMKPGEVAPLAGVAESTVKTWARTGKIPSARTPGGHIRVRLSDLAAMLATPANEEGLARCVSTETSP